MTESYAVRATGLRKSYGGKTALADVSLQVEKGSIHVLLGRNGSGKTTLAKILAGLLLPDEGSVETPRASGTRDAAFQRQVGFLFDTSAHWESLTGRENAWFFARSFGLDPLTASSRIDEVFDTLALDEVAHDLVSTYSYGMKRKLSIAEALMHDPRLLILDEPSIGLDFASRTKLYSLLSRAAVNGHSILVATNDINEAKHLAGEVSLMSGGRIVASGTPASLLDELRGNVMVQIDLGVPIPLKSIRDIEGVIEAGFSEEENRLQLHALVRSESEGSATADIIKILAASGSDITRIDLRRPDLGDVFLSRVGGERQ